LLKFYKTWQEAREARARRLKTEKEEVSFGTGSQTLQIVEKEIPPSLRFEQTETVNVGQLGALWVWQEVRAPNRGIVAVFRNTPKNMGMETPIAQSVYAQLVFRNVLNNNDKALHITGTWLDEYVNHVTFQCGTVRRLLVAVRIADRLHITLENQETINPLTGRRWRFNRYPHIISPQRKPLPWPSGRLEVSLIDRFSVTVFHGYFSYDFESGNWSLSYIPGLE
jgi:hypothetical protein